MKGKRDAVGIRHNSLDSSDNSRSHSPTHATDSGLLKLINQLTKDDAELRHKKESRFRAMTEAMKLSRAVNNIIVSYLYSLKSILLLKDLMIAYFSIPPILVATISDLLTLLIWLV